MVIIYRCKHKCVTITEKNYLVVWSGSPSCFIDGAPGLNDCDKHQSGNASYNDP